MRAFTFTPNPQIIAALQQKHASPGEVFFGLLITQEPVDKTKCKTIIRAMTEREYRDLLGAFAQRGDIGQPDQGLFLVGPKVSRIARGSGRIVAKKMLPPGKGFAKIVIEPSLRPLGSTPSGTAPPMASSEEKNDDDLFSSLEEDDDTTPGAAFAHAAENAATQFDIEGRGQPSPRAYAQAAEQGAAQYDAPTGAAGANNGVQSEGDPQARLRWAQEVAMQSANQTMTAGPGGPRGPQADPFHPANRAQMAHRVGLESTYASMPNGQQMMKQMGFGQPPPRQGARRGDLPSRGPGNIDPDAIADSVLDDLWG